MSEVNKSFHDMLEYVHLYRLKTNCTVKRRIMIAKFEIIRSVYFY